MGRGSTGLRSAFENIASAAAGFGADKFCVETQRNMREIDCLHEDSQFFILLYLFFSFGLRILYFPAVNWKRNDRMLDIVRF